jgi:hypothetical protein
VRARADEAAEVIDEHVVAVAADVPAEAVVHVPEAIGLAVGIRGDRRLRRARGADHGGRDDGAAAERAVVDHEGEPARGVGVAVFSNTTGSATNLVDAVASYVYDRMAGRADADAALDAAVDEILAKHAELAARIRADRAQRAGRAWTLSQPRSAYAGTYVNDRYGTIEITADGDALHVRFGVLHSVAEAASKPEAIRVELVPFSGEPIEFDLGGGSAPVAATYDGERYVRRGAAR